MAVYRFRVVFEDNEDIQRDIEIRANQTFFDFHTAIQEAIKFDNKHAASFFVSDDYWRKNQEITLLQEDLDEDVKLMAKVKISSVIENPYQRFIYLFDKKVQWSLMIELIKITEEDAKKQYPCCAKSLGTAPKQYKIIKPAEQESLSPEAAMNNLLEDLHDDTDAYKHADEEKHLVDEEDVKLMEGEEGEEESEEEEMNGENEQGDDPDFENAGDGHDDDKY